ncbi:MAG TPA: hypothetical protein DHN33_04325 [Eubacteriaceae bacterium]|nr:hypothetical protein [Eubacteriaceae bacterium]
MSKRKELFGKIANKSKSEAIKFINKKRGKEPEQSEESEKSQKKQSASVKFKVAWTNKYFNTLDKFAKDHFKGKEYAGATKDKLEEGEEFSQFGKIEGTGKVNFVPEPDNKYSERAMKVVLEDYGQVGYVPEKAIDRFNNFISKNEYDIKWILNGGRIKTEAGIEKDQYDMTIRIFKITEI